MPFRPNSSELSKNNAQNIIHIPALIFQKFFDFERNAYSQASSWNSSFVNLRFIA